MILKLRIRVRAFCAALGSAVGNPRKLADMHRKFRYVLLFPGVLFTLLPKGPTFAAEIGFADIVLEFFDSGTGPIPGPYGGTFTPSFTAGPIPVSPDVVLGSEPGPTGLPDFLSLPTGSFVTVGFTDETIIDGPGFDFVIVEFFGTVANADIFISADGTSFTFLGAAIADTSFDLADIAFTDPVIAIKIEGRDLEGSSPGFDLLNIEIAPGSIGLPIPEPSTLALAGLGLIALLAYGWRRCRGVAT